NWTCKGLVGKYPASRKTFSRVICGGSRSSGDTATTGERSTSGGGIAAVDEVAPDCLLRTACGSAGAAGFGLDGCSAGAGSQAFKGLEKRRRPQPAPALLINSAGLWAVPDRADGRAA